MRIRYIHSVLVMGVLNSKVYNLLGWTGRWQCHHTPRWCLTFLSQKHIDTHSGKASHNPPHLSPSKILCRHSDGEYRGRAERRVSLCRLCFSFQSHCLSQPGTTAWTDSQLEIAIRHLWKTINKETSTGRPFTTYSYHLNQYWLLRGMTS